MKTSEDFHIDYQYRLRLQVSDEMSAKIDVIRKRALKRKLQEIDDELFAIYQEISASDGGK